MNPRPFIRVHHVSRLLGLILQRIIGLRARIVAGEFDRERLASNLKTLGDVNRLRIIELLWDGQELCACKILENLEISQPTLSHHMAALREAGVIRARRDGRWMHYRLDHDVLDAIAALLGQNIAYSAWEDPEEHGIAGSHPTIGRRRLPTASARPPLGHPSTGRWTASPGRVTLTLARPMDSGPMRGHHREETRRSCAFRHPHQPTR